MKELVIITGIICLTVLLCFSMTVGSKPAENQTQHIEGSGNDAR